jgi:GNAT superfamily N-acetyltransferase
VEEIRPGRPEDAAAIAQIHIGGWQAFYRGQVPDAMLDGFDLERRTDGWRRQLEDLPGHHRLWVLERDGRIIGFCATAHSADPDAGPETGEIPALYLSPEVVGTGVGRRLFGHAVADLRTRGFAEATLWVLVSNALGRRFYEAAGWRPDGTEKDQPWGNHVLHEVRYRIDLTDRPRPRPAS